MLKIKHKVRQCLPLSRKHLSLYICLLVLSHHSVTYGEDADTLMLIAEDYILSNLPPQLKNPSVSISPLPKSTQRPDCEHTPIAQYHGKQRIGNINLVLTCQQPRWQQYIHAQINGLLAAYVARHDIAANTAFHAKDLTLSWLPHQQVSRQNVSDIHVFTHKASRQFIRAGTPIRLSFLKDNVLVRKNDQVNIRSNDPRIRIEMQGIALESGSFNQAIRVQNTSSNKIIKAYIESADTVIVK